MRAFIESEQEAHKISTEQWLNEYNDACVSYLLGSITERQFGLSLSNEVKELFEILSPHQKRLLSDEGKKQYEALHKVYNKLIS